MLGYILTAVIIVSLVSLIGILTLSMKKTLLNKILLVLVAFAAGTLLGGAYFDLLPEALESSLDMDHVDHELEHEEHHEEHGEEADHEEEHEERGFLHLFVALITGILSFFVIERFVFWRHCHHHVHSKEHKEHSFTYMNLIGDAFHNFLDGVVISGAFLHSTSVGIATTIAVVLHEIPQEIGDFAILLHGGFSKAKALLFNFFSALAAILGAVIAYFYFSAFEAAIPWMLAFTAGGFTYIAVADLIPEIKKEQDMRKGLLHVSFLILGVIFMWWLNSVLPHVH